MTQIDFVNALNTWQLNAAAYANAAIGNYPSLGTTDKVGDRAGVGPFILAGDWPGLQAYCQGKMSATLSKVVLLANERSQINSLYAGILALKPDFSTYYVAPGSNATWQGYRAQMYQDMVNQGMSATDAETFLTKLDTKGGQNAYELAKGALDQYPLLVNDAIEGHIGQYAYYYHADALAQVNIHFANPVVLGYNVSNKINSLSNGLKTRQTTVYNKIKALDIAGAVSSCNTYIAWINARMQAEIAPIVAYCRQARNAVGSSFTNDGRRAMKAGALFQEAVYCRALFEWIRFMAQWHAEVKTYKELTAKAASLAATTVGISGTTVSVSTLNGNPAAYDGQDVVVEGVLSNLAITHVTATKVKSTAEVKNSAGVAVNVVLPHIKLDSGGLIVGAYVKLSGRFAASNAEAGGSPAISLSRLPLGDLAQTSWHAWLRQQLSNVYVVVPHNLETTFSGEPGADGLVNPVKYAVTANTTTTLKITNKVY